jgi:hypothetical protein
MPPISLRAHFDGERIVLDEPFDLVQNSTLLVTILGDDERNDWTRLAAASLSRAYGDDETKYLMEDVAAT